MISRNATDRIAVWSTLRERRDVNLSFIVDDHFYEVQETQSVPHRLGRFKPDA